MVLAVLTCCLDSWWPGLVFMAEPTKARRFSARLPKCCQIHQIQIQQLFLINKLSLRPMDRSIYSMTFGQTFVHLIGPRQKPPAEGHWKLPGGWNWQKLLMEKCPCNTIQSMHIYAISMPYALICLRKSPSLGETLSMWPGAGDMRPAKPEAELPGSLGSGLKRQVRMVEVVTYFIQIYSIHELWYINGNRSSVHRACGIGSTLMNFIAKAEEKQRGRYHLNGICLWKDSCLDTWPLSNCQDAAAANSFVAFLHYTRRAF